MYGSVKSEFEDACNELLYQCKLAGFDYDKKKHKKGEKIDKMKKQRAIDSRKKIKELKAKAIGLMMSGFDEYVKNK